MSANRSSSRLFTLDQETPSPRPLGYIYPRNYPIPSGPIQASKAWRAFFADLHKVCGGDPSRATTVTRNIPFLNRIDILYTYDRLLADSGRTASTTVADAIVPTETASIASPRKRRLSSTSHDATENDTTAPGGSPVADGNLTAPSRTSPRKRPRHPSSTHPERNDTAVVGGASNADGSLVAASTESPRQPRGSSSSTRVAQSSATAPGGIHGAHTTPAGAPSASPRKRRRGSSSAHVKQNNTIVPGGPPVTDDAPVAASTASPRKPRRGSSSHVSQKKNLAPGEATVADHAPAAASTASPRKSRHRPPSASVQQNESSASSGSVVADAPPPASVSIPPAHGGQAEATVTGETSHASPTLPAPSPSVVSSRERPRSPSSVHVNDVGSLSTVPPSKLSVPCSRTASRELSIPTHGQLKVPSHTRPPTDHRDAGPTSKVDSGTSSAATPPTPKCSDTSARRTATARHVPQSSAIAGGSGKGDGIKRANTSSGNAQRGFSPPKPPFSFHVVSSSSHLLIEPPWLTLLFNTKTPIKLHHIASPSGFLAPRDHSAPSTQIPSASSRLSVPPHGYSSLGDRPSSTTGPIDLSKYKHAVTPGFGCFECAVRNQGCNAPVQYGAYSPCAQCAARDQPCTIDIPSLGLSRANGSPPADSVVTAAASVLHSSALVADWISMREANAAVSRHIAITSTGAFQALRSIRNFQAELWELRSRVDDLQDQLTPPSPHDD